MGCLPHGLIQAAWLCSSHDPSNQIHSSCRTEANKRRDVSSARGGRLFSCNFGLRHGYIYFGSYSRLESLSLHPLGTFPLKEVEQAKKSMVECFERDESFRERALDDPDLEAIWESL